MASIIISDLEPAGANLFRDSESFLHELTEQEVGSVLGGLKNTTAELSSDVTIVIAFTLLCVRW
jgi:hypothetical protein